MVGDKLMIAALANLALKSLITSNSSFFSLVWTSCCSDSVVSVESTCATVIDEADRQMTNIEVFRILIFM